MNLQTLKAELYVHAVHARGELQSSLQFQLMHEILLIPQHFGGKYSLYASVTVMDCVLLIFSRAGV